MAMSASFFAWARKPRKAMEAETSAAASQDTLLVRWRAAKAEAERLWYLLHKERVCAKRKERYRSDPLYRQAIQRRALNRRLRT